MAGVKIAIEEGDGYVSRDYVNLRTDFVCAESREEEEARLAKEAQEREQARAAATAAEASRAKEKAKKKQQHCKMNFLPSKNASTALKINIWTEI